MLMHNKVSTVAALLLSAFAVLALADDAPAKTETETAAVREERRVPPYEPSYPREEYKQPAYKQPVYGEKEVKPTYPAKETYRAPAKPAYKEDYPRPAAPEYAQRAEYPQKPKEPVYNNRYQQYPAEPVYEQVKNTYETPRYAQYEQPAAYVREDRYNVRPKESGVRTVRPLAFRNYRPAETYAQEYEPAKTAAYRTADYRPAYDEYPRVQQPYREEVKEAVYPTAYPASYNKQPVYPEVYAPRPVEYNAKPEVYQQTYAQPAAEYNREPYSETRYNDDSTYLRVTTDQNDYYPSYVAEEPYNRAININHNRAYPSNQPIQQGVSVSYNAANGQYERDRYQTDNVPRTLCINSKCTSQPIVTNLA